MNKRQWVIAALLAWALGMAVLLYLVEPGSTPYYPQCPTWRFLHVYCPGCGTARALYRLLHGELMAAIRLNVLFVLLLPGLMHYAVSYLLYWGWQRPMPDYFFSNKLPAIVLAVLVMYTLARNLPWWPWLLLAPH